MGLIDWHEGRDGLNSGNADVLLQGGFHVKMYRLIGANHLVVLIADLKREYFIFQKRDLMWSLLFFFDLFVGEAFLQG